MRLSRASSEIFVPDGSDAASALARVTHLGIAAHQDDIEIMAMEGILTCFGVADRWFLAAIVTDGAGSPRDGLYGKYSDEEMRAVRRVEQKKAAYVGEYSAVAFLDHPSSVVKNPAESAPQEDLKALIAAAQPEVVYTHNLADKHDTHVAVALRAIAAIRELPPSQRPKKLYGSEVWRDLDWMVDEDKVVFRLDEHENLAAALVGGFDSQIAGGKRYDLATLGRRRAHATYHQSHAVDAARMINFGMDLTPLIAEPSLDINEFLQQHIRRFAADVSSRLAKLV
ncbi:MAG: PIG-L family deacetylase [Acidobacteria bacterium]|nr:PIG-L family deacetylase [Acidobacteriota bacterium]